MAKKLARVTSPGKMARVLKVTYLRTKFTEMAATLGLMDATITAVGRTTRCMVRASIPGPIIASTSESTYMTRNMDMASLIGPTDESTKETTRTENRMALVFTSMGKVRPNTASGSKANGLNGSRRSSTMRKKRKWMHDDNGPFVQM